MDTVVQWNIRGFRSNFEELKLLLNRSQSAVVAQQECRLGEGQLPPRGYTLLLLRGKLMPHKWENCMTIDKYSWGYRANARLSDYYTVEELLKELITTVSLGGNLLINIGPTSYGEIAPIFEERLSQLGDWLSVNGEAIYKTQVWSHQNDSHTKDVWYTAKNGSSGQTTVYALLLTWPKTEILILADPVPSTATRVTLLGVSQPLSWSAAEQGKGIKIAVPSLPINKMPCKWAWVLKLEDLQNQKIKINPMKFSQHHKSIAMRKERGF
ncbi:alpha-l-fucosidase-like [Plakobranchus ocellatus]|uniref:alpha-L-fucosidase n=1 Tax=Plakobranchus ocellatus TaxID=259542 RepID=A0AAV4BF15_9GAST|nr:alpha-l-fucosidase-like [Plakobranchus ocellatus]